MQNNAEMFLGLASTSPDNSTATEESEPVPGEPVTSDPFPVDVAEYWSRWVCGLFWSA